MENQSKIILNRPTQWVNRLRGYRVFIDGAEVGRVKNGTMEEFPVAAGTHKISCKMDWTSSREFVADLKPGETMYLLVKSGLKNFWWVYSLLVAGLIYHFYLKFNDAPEPEYSIYIRLILIVPGFLYMLYFMTARRKDYLVIEKDSKNVFAK